jgi:two-component system chemotaxis response regulator CheB
MTQDQATSSVWGMPRAVAESGCADEILAVGDIGPRMCTLFGLA